MQKKNIYRSILSFLLMVSLVVPSSVFAEGRSYEAGEKEDSACYELSVKQSDLSDIGVAEVVLTSDDNAPFSNTDVAEIAVLDREAIENELSIIGEPFHVDIDGAKTSAFEIRVRKSDGNIRAERTEILFKLENTDLLSSYSNSRLFHVIDNNHAEELDFSVNEDDITVSFKTETFSPFIFIKQTEEHAVIRDHAQEQDAFDAHEQKQDAEAHENITGTDAENPDGATGKENEETNSQLHGNANADERMIEKVGEQNTSEKEPEDTNTKSSEKTPAVSLKKNKTKKTSSIFSVSAAPAGYFTATTWRELKEHINANESPIWLTNDLIATEPIIVRSDIAIEGNNVTIYRNTSENDFSNFVLESGSLRLGEGITLSGVRATESSPSVTTYTVNPTGAVYNTMEEAHAALNDYNRSWRQSQVDITDVADEEKRYVDVSILNYTYTTHRFNDEPSFTTDPHGSIFEYIAHLAIMTYENGEYVIKIPADFDQGRSEDIYLASDASQQYIQSRLDDLQHNPQTYLEGFSFQYMSSRYEFITSTPTVYQVSPTGQRFTNRDEAEVAANNYVNNDSITDPASGITENTSTAAGGIIPESIRTPMAASEFSGEKGFFVDIRGGELILDGAVLTDMYLGMTENPGNSPVWTAPVYIRRGSAEFVSGSIQNNIVSYLPNDAKSVWPVTAYSGTQNIVSYVTGMEMTNTAGAFIVDGSNALLGINGSNAAIHANKADCGAIIATNGASVNFASGTISDNIGFHHAGAILTEDQAEVAMSGGVISGNTAWFRGGGVYATEFGTSGYMQRTGGSVTNKRDPGAFLLLGGTITGNTAFARAGAIMVESDRVTLIEGDITGNNCRSLGGAIYVAGDYPDYTYTLTLNKGNIKDNAAVQGANQILDRYLANGESIHMGSPVTMQDTTDAHFSGSNMGAGGGLWLCPLGGVGRISLNGTNNVKIDGNFAQRTGTDIFSYGRTGGVYTGSLLADDQWYVETPGTLINSGNMAEEGMYYSTELSLVNHTSRSDVDGGVNITGNLSRDGGGIAADGTVLIGESVSDIVRAEKPTLAITKTWAAGTEKKNINFRLVHKVQEQERTVSFLIADASSPELFNQEEILTMTGNAQDTWNTQTTISWEDSYGDPILLLTNPANEQDLLNPINPSDLMTIVQYVKNHGGAYTYQIDASGGELILEEVTTGYQTTISDLNEVTIEVQTNQAGNLNVHFLLPHLSASVLNEAEEEPNVESYHLTVSKRTSTQNYPQGSAFTYRLLLGNPAFLDSENATAATKSLTPATSLPSHVRMDRGLWPLSLEDNASAKAAYEATTIFTRNTSLTKEEVEAIPESGPTYRLNIGGTGAYPVYSWIEGGTFYWWCEADVVYLPSNSHWMFGDYEAEIIDMTGLNASDVTKINYMFSGTTVPSLDLSMLDMTHVTSSSNAFSVFEGANIGTLDIRHFGILRNNALQSTSIGAIALGANNSIANDGSPYPWVQYADLNLNTYTNTSNPVNNSEIRNYNGSNPNNHGWYKPVGTTAENEGMPGAATIYSVTVPVNNSVDIEIPASGRYFIEEIRQEGWTLESKSGHFGSAESNGSGTAVFNNIYNQETPPAVAEYSLTISKKAYGDNSAENYDFILDLAGDNIETADITYRKYDASGNIVQSGTLSGVHSEFTLSNRQTVELTGIPQGSQYSIIEPSANNPTTITGVDGDGTPLQNGDGVYGMEGILNADALVEFTNKRVGYLSVAKLVSGNMGNKHEEFTFELDLSGEDVERSQISYMKSSGETGSVHLRNGKFTFTLKDSEGVVFDGIMQGTVYTITELQANSNGYTTTARGSGIAVENPLTLTVSASGVIDNNEFAEFTNTKNTAIPTRIPPVNDWRYWVGLMALTIIAYLAVAKRKKKA